MRAIAALSASILLAAACSRDAGETTPVVVAAAADLTLAFEDLGQLFRQQTGTDVTLSFGSTGLLAEQLRQGAPFDVFAAADVAVVDEVVAAGICDRTTIAPYARGRIAVWSRRGSVAPVTALEQLADPRLGRIALANPEHAPYGRAAQQALESVGVWSSLQPRLVLGENVRQALQFAQTGNVEAAIVPLSLVIGDRENPWFLVDDRLHQPIEQALVVCTGGARRQDGEAFARFVNSELGRSVMRRYGLTLPGEEATQGP